MPEPWAWLVKYAYITSTIVSAGIGLLAFGLSASLSMLTIGIAWLAYRPTLTWILAACAAVIFVVLYIRGRREESRA